MYVYGIRIVSWEANGLPGLAQAYLSSVVTSDTQVDWYLYDCAGNRYIYWYYTTASIGTDQSQLLSSGDFSILERISSGDYQLAAKVANDTDPSNTYFRSGEVFHLTSSGGGGDSGGGDDDETYDIGDGLELGYIVNNGQVVAMVRYMNAPYPSSFPDRYISWNVGGNLIGNTNITDDGADFVEFAYDGTLYGNHTLMAAINYYSSASSGYVWKYLQVPVTIDSGGGGGDITEQWTQSYGGKIEVNDDSPFSFAQTVSKRVTTKMTVESALTGTITVSSASNIDVYGYLSVSDNGIDAETGEPISPNMGDDDGAGNGQFQLEYFVNANTTYYLWFKGNDESVSGNITINVSFETAPENTYNIGSPNLVCSLNSVNNTITAYVTNMNGSYPSGFIDRSITWSLNDVTKGITTVTDDEATTSDVYTFSDIIIGNSYVVKARIGYYTSSTDTEKTYYDVTATVTDVTVSFSWSNYGVAPTDNETLFVPKAVAWNGLVDAVNTKCGTSFTKVGAGYPITASRYNQVAQALGTPTVIAKVTPMYGSYWCALENAVNS
jgi:hypothetical protein